MERVGRADTLTNVRSYFSPGILQLQSHKTLIPGVWDEQLGAGELRTGRCAGVS